MLFTSCGRKGSDEGGKFITVSIAPFKYFVEAIGGNDFKVNVMVPPGANPHEYEPFPKQISTLSKSVGYISDGYLDFEITWLDRFYETNRSMKKLSLSQNIDLLRPDSHGDSEHVTTADPHYWVSPKCALIMAASVRDFLSGLNPVHKNLYQENYNKLVLKIEELDKKATGLFSGLTHRSFMIYHPNLGYLARDYGLEEITVEYEGKEPPPSAMKALIDRARIDGIKTIFIQKEFDTKNAREIAHEIGGKVVIIDPLSEDWFNSTLNIINALHDSLTESSK